MRLKHHSDHSERRQAINGIRVVREIPPVHVSQDRKRRCAGVTLVEVVISVMIVAMSIGGIMSVYTQAAVNAEWSAHSLAAQMMALSGLEQARAAKYDPRGSTDELVATNFPIKVDKLDTGTSLGVCTYATNTTTISMISTNPAMKMIRVDCVWTFPRKGIFTNSVYTYRGANQ